MQLSLRTIPSHFVGLRLLSALTLLAGAALNGWTQTQKPATPSAEQVVRALEARYRGASRTGSGALQARFLERYSRGPRDVRVESGTVYFSAPGRMRWEYESPEEKLFLADGKHVWFYVPADRTVTRARVKESADWHTPLALLAGKSRRGALGQLCGRIELVAASSSSQGTRDTASAANLHLRCSPKSADALFTEVLFEVDPTYRLAGVIVREAGGLETEFRFANWRENVAVPESKFHFQPPPGVAIVEESSISGPIR